MVFVLVWYALNGQWVGGKKAFALGLFGFCFVFTSKRKRAQKSVTPITTIILTLAHLAYRHADVPTPCQ